EGEFWVKPMAKHPERLPKLDIWVPERVKGHLHMIEAEYIKKGGEGVKYLSGEEREQYLIRIAKDKGSTVFIWQGKVVDLKDFQILRRLLDAPMTEPRAIFVLTASGKLYMAAQNKANELYGKLFQHSSFLAGEPVAMAGEIWFEKGSLKGISDVSGHYMVDIEGDVFMLQTLLYFKKLGIDIDNVDVVFAGGRGKAKAGKILRYVDEEFGGNIDAFAKRRIDIRILEREEKKEAPQERKEVAEEKEEEEEEGEEAMEGYRNANLYEVFGAERE
ncbi:hypothetical protein ACFLX5_01560, partial [Chloroflexota bacterium]